MNEYQLFEAGNMQPDADAHAMPLTPRIELREANNVYMNIADLSASINEGRDGERIVIETRSKLLDKNQHSPAGGEIQCKVSYTFSSQKTVLHFAYDDKAITSRPIIIIPVVSAETESIDVISGSVIEIKKENARVRISCNHPITRLPTTNGRVFNFVPGLEAIPLAVDQNNAIVEIEVIY